MEVSYFMAQYDGAIRIVTKITTKDAEESLSSLEWTIKNSAKEIDKLRKKMYDLKGQKVYTDDYKKLQSDLSQAEETLASWNEELKKPQSENAIKTINTRIKETKSLIDSIKDEMQILEEKGKAFTLGEDTAQYNAWKKQIEYEEEAIVKAGDHYIKLKEGTNEIKNMSAAYRKYLDALEEARNPETGLVSAMDAVKIQTSYMVDSVKEKVSNLKAAIKNAFTHPIQTARKGIGNLKSAFIGLGSIGKKSLSFMGSKLKNMTASMLGFGKSAKKSGGLLSTLGSRFKGLALSLLIFNQISKAFNAMISGIKEGFSNLAGENASFQNQVNSLKASLLTLKNALAGAFAPIVQIAIPYIQQLIGWLTSAISAVGQFIAALTGRKTYIKAVQQTAGAFEDAAGAANDAKEAAEGYLSPLDEINKYSDGKDKGAGAGGGGGAGGAGQMFEEVPIESKFKGIAQWFKDMWADADFTELGTLLGKKLKSALEKIPWDSIQQTAAKVGKSFATLINGFVEVPELGYTIGKSIGEAINTGIELSNNFFDNTHWDSIGKFFGEGLNGIIESIKWKDLGHNLVAKFRAVVITAINFLGSINFGSISKGLSEFAIGIFDSLSDLIAEIEWSKLPRWIIDSVLDFFNGFDYKSIFSSIGKLIGTAVVAGIDLIAALGEVLADIGTKVKDFFVEKFKEAGWSEDGGFIENGIAIVNGLLNGILEGISGIGKWIYENIFLPFINGFKDAFGIHSPSTVMAEMGKFLIQGLLDGIKGLAGSVKQAWDSMKQTAVSTWETVKQNIGEKWEQIKSNSSTTFSNIAGNIRTVWANIGTNIKTSVDNAKNNISTAWSTAKENTRTAWDSMKTKATTAVRNIASSVKEKYSDIENYISNFTSSSPDAWEDAWSGMQNALNGILGNMKNAVSSVLDWISDRISSLGNALRNLTSRASSSKSSSSSSRFSSSRIMRSASPYALYPEMASVDMSSIPGYATGQVIPTTMKRHLAVLGDNNRETEVVSPLSTIRQALREEAMSLGLTGGNGKGNTYNIKAEANRRVIFELMIEEGKMQQMSTGNNPFMLGNT